MTLPRPDEPRAGLEPATLAEDVLLLLFQPGSGTIAGETTLYYVLAGAVLAELATGGHVQTGADGKVAAVPTRRPADDVLRSAWDYVSEKPRGVQTILAAVGPRLRGPVLERLVVRGDIRQTRRKALGLFDTTALESGTGRRAALLADVRAVLVDGVEPSPRIGALAALLSASGTLPQFDPEIPWTSSVITRAQELERGRWGAEEAAEAVARTMTAIIVNNVVIAAAILRGR